MVTAPVQPPFVPHPQSSYYNHPEFNPTLPYRNIGTVTYPEATDHHVLLHMEPVMEAVDYDALYSSMYGICLVSSSCL